MKNILKKLIRYLIEPLLNEDGKGDTVTHQTTVVPGKSPAEIELDEKNLELTQLKIEEAKKQAKLLEEFSPMYKESAQQQAALMQQQIEMQKESAAKLEEYLNDPVRKASEEYERKLLEKQLKYAQGEMAELTPEEQGQLDELTSTYKQQVLSDVLAQQKRGMRDVGNVSLARGLQSSSIRDWGADQVRAEGLKAAGAADRDIEGMRFEASWKMPQAKQTFETGVGQFQSALNQQAEANRANLYKSLSTSIQSPFESLGSYLGYTVGGTNLINAPDMKTLYSEPSNEPIARPTGGKYL